MGNEQTTSHEISKTEMELLLNKYGKQSLFDLFESLIEADDKASAMTRGAALLLRARDSTLEMLESTCARLASSASQVRAKYSSLYKEADLNREREEELRVRKTRELVGLVLLRLECLARRKRDPVDVKDRTDLVALLEEASLLLVNPSIDPWLDLVDFCEDNFGADLRSFMALVFEELEVAPHSRKRDEALAEASAGEAETSFVRDKKRIKNELAASKTVEPKPTKSASLGSLRKIEKKTKASVAIAAAAPPPVVVKKIKVKRKSPMKKKS
jgi:hypothetical protein